MARTGIRPTIPPTPPRSRVAAGSGRALPALAVLAVAVLVAVCAAVVGVRQGTAAAGDPGAAQVAVRDSGDRAASPALAGRREEFSSVADVVVSLEGPHATRGRAGADVPVSTDGGGEGGPVPAAVAAPPAVPVVPPGAGRPWAPTPLGVLVLGALLALVLALGPARHAPRRLPAGVPVAEAPASPAPPPAGPATPPPAEDAAFPAAPARPSGPVPPCAGGRRGPAPGRRGPRPPDARPPRSRPGRGPRAGRAEVSPPARGGATGLQRAARYRRRRRPAARRG